MEKEYIGDGVYVSCDGFQIWLTTSRAGHEDRIALEPHVWLSLLDYMKRLAKETNYSPNLMRSEP